MKQIEGSVEEPYVSEVQSEVARLRSDHKNYIRTRYAYVFMYVFIAGLAVYLTPPGNFGYLIFAFSLVALVIFFSMGNMMRNWLQNSVLICPHCEAEVMTGLAWICGWCSNKNTNETQYIFNGCGHRTCKQKPNAMRCPECGKDIVLRERSYNRERSNSAQRVAGVAKFVGLPDNVRFIANFFPIKVSENSKQGKLLIEKQIEDELDKDIG